MKVVLSDLGLDSEVAVYPHQTSRPSVALALLRQVDLLGLYMHPDLWLVQKRRMKTDRVREQLGVRLPTVAFKGILVCR